MSIDLFATLAIMGIAAGIAFLNSGINRVLINYFIGWEQYRVMQREMAEYRSETMAAMRAKDTKQVEKLKKKDSQIKNMQAKMMKGSFHHRQSSTAKYFEPNGFRHSRGNVGSFFAVQ